MAAAISAGASGFASEQLRVRVAERNADRAEAEARALRRQAASAQQAADVAQEGARNLKVRADQAQGEAGLARQNLSSLTASQQLSQGFENIRSQIAEGFAALDAPAPAPTVNAEGQTTGTLINVTA